MPADKLTSDSARKERKAWVAKIRRMIKQLENLSLRERRKRTADAALFELTLYGKDRRKRYDKSPGGLGRK